MAEEHAFRVWRLRQKVETLEFAGMFQANDHVLGKPVLDLDDLVFPIKANGGLTFRRVAPDQFAHTIEPKAL
jgi:hypothetical protein